MTPEQRIQFLEEQIRHLSSEKLEALRAMELAAGLGNFGTSLNKLTDPIPILQETTVKIRSLFKFKVLCFYLVNESDSNFIPAYCQPQKDFLFIRDEVERLIEESTFAWCLGRNKPYITMAMTRKETLVLHTLATLSRIRGIFVGVLGQERFSISDSSMSLFTILLHACAQQLESYELYSWNRRTLEEMQEQLHTQQAAEEKINLHLQEMTQQLRTAQVELERTKKKINKEAVKHQEMESTYRNLAKLDKTVQKLTQQFLESTSPEANARYAAQAAARLTGSMHAFACWIDPAKQMVCLPVLDKATLRHFSLQQQDTMLATALPGEWGTALLAGKSFYSNEPVDAFPLQQGVKKTLGPKRILSVPVLDVSAATVRLIGHITLSNASRPYGAPDAQAIERIAALYALSLKKLL